MIHRHENPEVKKDTWKAGFYAVAVHAVLLAGMLFSFNWKAAHPVVNVTEVDLWDKLPAPVVTETPQPEVKEPPTPEVPKPEVKEPPKPTQEEKPKEEAPKVDIELENKKKEQEQKAQKEIEEKEKLAQLKKEKELEKKKKLEALQAELRQDELRDKQEKKQQDALKKLQQEALSDEHAASDKQASATNASLIGEFTEKIKAKIRGNVNKTLCGDGNPQLIFEISVLPTGQLSGTPKITKSSGNDACDEAVERAIIASEPLPLPDDASLKSQFKNLKLKFRPND